MTYQAPVDDIIHALKTAAGLDDLIGQGLLGGVDEDTIRAVIEEAGKFAAEVLEPLSAPGDRAGSKLVDGKVVTPPGWKEAYQQFAAGGWGALSAPEEWGGQNLPQVIATAAGEVWNSSNLAFGLCPLLTFGAIDAIEHRSGHEIGALPAADFQRLIDEEIDLRAFRLRSAPSGGRGVARV
jgi:alkylation response protein AidB-like acyl-CoA dehydrogenase